MNPRQFASLRTPELRWERLGAPRLHRYASIRNQHGWSLLLLGMLLFACTRSSVPVGVQQPTAPEPQLESQPWVQETDVAEDYAVVWIPDREKLSVRNPAGIAGPVVTDLAFDKVGILLTGNTTRLGSSTWIEISLPGGRSGWVNRWNLTEYVPIPTFCQDGRSVALMEIAVEALRGQDGVTLASIVNPQRGLVLRHDWWNPDVVFSIPEVENIFTDREEHDWGVQGGGGFPLRGSFRDLLLPLVQDVFLEAPEVSCNTLTTALTAREMTWPPEFENLRFYAFHRPARLGGNPYEWRTWALGIEYINGEPTLAVMLQFRGDV